MKLPKPIAEIASTFMKDGMNLDDAVLAAFRIMDETPDPAIQKILARDKKFNPESGPGRGVMFNYKTPRDVKSYGGFVQKDINNTIESLQYATPDEAAALRRAAMANENTPLNENVRTIIDELSEMGYRTPGIVGDDLSMVQKYAERVRKMAARRYAMEQLGLTDNGIL